MTPDAPSHKLRQRLWRGLTSLRLALGLLLVLAVAALIGTVLPQGEPYSYYLKRFGAKPAWLFWQLGLSAVYQSFWFLALLGLLFINLLACSIRRLPESFRRVRQPLTLEKYQSLPERGQVRWQAPGLNPRTRLETVLRPVLGRTQVYSQGNAVWYLSNRGRFGPLGPYLIHLGIVLIILGGILGMLFGFEGEILIPEGETAETIKLKRQGENLPLDFTVRLDRFQVLYYPDGMPKEYRSDLSFFRDGQQVFTDTCRVNDPVHFQGLTFYQASYQTVPNGPIRLNICHGGLCTRVEVPFRTKVGLPGGKGSIIALRLENDYRGQGPAILLAYKNGPGHPAIFWVLKNSPPDSGYQVGTHRFTVAELNLRYASGLMVKKDPGVWWVYLGFIVFLPGFWLAFFTPRQRWAVALQPEPTGGWLIRVHAAGTRPREAFHRRLTKVLAQIEKGASP